MLSLLLACQDPALVLEGDPDAGAVTYDAECTLCHAPDGTGSSRGPAITGLFDRLAPSLTLQVIREGRGTMPAFPLADQELADLLAWLDTL